jgi:hypothetical protein
LKRIAFPAGSVVKVDWMVDGWIMCKKKNIVITRRLFEKLVDVIYFTIDVIYFTILSGTSLPFLALDFFLHRWAIWEQDKRVGLPWHAKGM